MQLTRNLSNEGRSARRPRSSRRPRTQGLNLLLHRFGQRNCLLNSSKHLFAGEFCSDRECVIERTVDRFLNLRAAKILRRSRQSFQIEALRITTSACQVNREYLFTLCSARQIHKEYLIQPPLSQKFGRQLSN